MQNNNLKKKIGKQIWFDGELWDVIKIISPTKFDNYILVTRTRIDQVHFETNINPIEMALIDCGNDQFYPNTPKVRGILSELNKDQIRIGLLKEQLSNIWLNSVKNK